MTAHRGARLRSPPSVSALLALTLALCWVGATTPEQARAQAPGVFRGDPPGVGQAALLVAVEPVAPETLAAALAAAGCTVQTLAVLETGHWDVYVAGAPAVVNAAFPPTLAAGTPFFVRCRPGPSAGGTPRPVALVPAFGGRVFEQPTEIGAFPGNRMFVAEQTGQVLLFGLDGSGETMLLDLSDRVRIEGAEEGLLSVALDPAFGQNGRLWVYYSVAADPRRTRLSRFAVSGTSADPASEFVVLEVAQPFSNHNGGAIRFGPDGMLYLGLGDGGSSGDPQGHGQDTGTLLGSILRIDVSASSAGQRYALPSDNPFTSGGGRPEIWAYGFRNPWRMAFDAATGRLWVADVGEGAVEEIDIVQRGGNYGWNILEGEQCFPPGSGCSAAGTVLPVATYVHAGTGRCSVTGGVIYRGAAVPEIAGAYLYGDYCTGELWALDVTDPSTPVPIGEAPGRISSFGVDAAGEVYVLQFGGPALRIVSPAGP